MKVERFGEQRSWSPASACGAGWRRGYVVDSPVATGPDAAGTGDECDVAVGDSPRQGYFIRREEESKLRGA